MKAPGDHHVESGPRVKRARLLFCGELSPASVNGIAISSSRILRVLAERFDIIVVEEKRALGRSRFLSLLKMFRVLLEGFELSFKAMRWRPEVFYTTFPTSIFGGAKCLFFILLFRLFCRGRILLHVHRGDLVSFHERGRLPCFLVEACFDKSSTVLSLSRGQSHAYAKITSTPVLALVNSVERSPAIAWQPPAVPRLIFLSNYLPEKGLDTLLDAFKELRKTRQVELHCYGGGDAGRYLTRIAAESIRDVQIHGVLDEKDKYAVLQGFSLLAFPSYNEGQPLVILEAMAIGLPVVASHVGLIPEMVGEDYPFLVPPRDPLAMTQALEACLALADPEALGMLLKIRFRDLYSPESQKVRILEAFAAEPQGNHES